MLAEKTRQLRRSLKQCKPVFSLPSVPLVRQLVTSNSIFPGDTHLPSVSVWGWGQRRNEIKKAKLAGKRRNRKVPSAGQKEKGPGDWRGTGPEQSTKQMQLIERKTRPAFQSLRDRTCTWRRHRRTRCFFPGTGLSSQVTPYSFHGNDRPPHYQPQRTGTVLEISVALQQPTRLRPNTVSSIRAHPPGDVLL